MSEHFEFPENFDIVNRDEIDRSWSPVGRFMRWREVVKELIAAKAALVEIVRAERLMERAFVGMNANRPRCSWGEGIVLDEPAAPWPFAAMDALCSCGNTWIAVVPKEANTRYLECPRCHQQDSMTWERTGNGNRA